VSSNQSRSRVFPSFRLFSFRSRSYASSDTKIVGRMGRCICGATDRQTDRCSARGNGLAIGARAVAAVGLVVVTPIAICGACDRCCGPARAGKRLRAGSVPARPGRGGLSAQCSACGAPVWAGGRQTAGRIRTLLHQRSDRHVREPMYRWNESRLNSQRGQQVNRCASR
jgi:hypothetical protein